ncbi:MAG TPA: large conductance mechanosensitive channel protein MscL [Acetobacteraceae bacterium]|nr:large conductance mechanosensitive channel protein MscL [Acetobacteraceae bacterium]
MPSLPIRQPAWVQEFQAFIMRGNVVDLAVGIIIGVAFTAIVNSLVKDILNPLIGLAIGGIDFSNIFVTLKGPSQPTLAAAQTAGAVTLNIGVFINAVIQFLIVAFAVFWVVRLLNRMYRRAAPPAEAAPPPPPPEVALLTQIRDLLAEDRSAAAARSVETRPGATRA